MEPRWLRIAYEELRSGIREVPGATTHHPRILQYHGVTRLRATKDEVPWCAAFVGWCLEQSEVASTMSAAARSYLGWGVEVSPVHPPLGAVVVLKRGGAGQPGPEVRDAQGHVGFLLTHGAPGELLVLGGNQGDSVSLASYPVHRILSVRWPV